MQIPTDLNWDLTPREAMAQQAALARRVVTQNRFGTIQTVAGVDVGFEQDRTVARAAAVILSYPQLELVEYTVARRPVTFPYVPGLLSYRESPVVLDALRQLRADPDLIIVDGQGYAHPRRFGIACHLGVLLDKPTIGCAKSILVGRAEMPEERVGAWTPLIYHDEVVGAAIRSKLRTKPLYVSIGHRINLETAIEFVLQSCKGYRVPETTRYAHNVAGGAEYETGQGQSRLFE